MQLQHCEEMGIPWALILGESEIKRGVVKLRNVITREELEIPQNHIVEELKSKLESA